jgi:uncharacterized protein
MGREAAISPMRKSIASSMASDVFVDSSGWFAMVHREDAHHAEIASLARTLAESGSRFVTTDYVIDEACTLARVRAGFRVATRLLALLDQTESVRVEWIGSARFEKAKELFRRYDDQSFSFTDCTSFAVMRELRILRAITTDHHFAVAGFELLPEI